MVSVTFVSHLDDEEDDAGDLALERLCRPLYSQSLRMLLISLYEAPLLILRIW
jgi:hypothetical protein